MSTAAFFGVVFLLTTLAAIHFGDVDDDVKPVIFTIRSTLIGLLTAVLVVFFLN